MQDLYAGGYLQVFSRTFELMDADEYTYTYMENNKHIFIMADAEAIIKSLRVQVGEVTLGHCKLVTTWFQCSYLLEEWRVAAAELAVLLQLIPQHQSWLLWPKAGPVFKCLVQFSSASEVPYT